MSICIGDSCVLSGFDVSYGEIVLKNSRFNGMGWQRPPDLIISWWVKIRFVRPKSENGPLLLQCQQPLSSIIGIVVSCSKRRASLELV